MASGTHAVTTRMEWIVERFETNARLVTCVNMNPWEQVEGCFISVITFYAGIPKPFWWCILMSVRASHLQKWYPSIWIKRLW